MPDQSTTQSMIQLNGVATREVANDVLSLSFTQTIVGKDATEVQEKLREDVKAALEVVKPFIKSGEVDVETDQFAVEPNYKNSKMIGYQGAAGITLRGTDTTTISKLASSIKTMVVSSSRNTMSRKARESVEAKLTQEAIKDFRKKADDAAKGFGAAGWKVGSISIATRADRGQMGKVFAMSAAVGGAESTPMQVQGGKSEINVHVSGSIILE